MNMDAVMDGSIIAVGRAIRYLLRFELQQRAHYPQLVATKRRSRFAGLEGVLQSCENLFT